MRKHVVDFDEVFQEMDKVEDAKQETLVKGYASKETEPEISMEPYADNI